MRKDGRFSAQGYTILQDRGNGWEKHSFYMVEPIAREKLAELRRIAKAEKSGIRYKLK